MISYERLWEYLEDMIFEQSSGRGEYTEGILTACYEMQDFLDQTDDIVVEEKLKEEIKDKRPNNDFYRGYKKGLERALSIVEGAL